MQCGFLGCSEGDLWLVWMAFGGTPELPYLHSTGNILPSTPHAHLLGTRIGSVAGPWAVFHIGVCWVESQGVESVID